MAAMYLLVLVAVVAAVPVLVRRGHLSDPGGEVYEDKQGERVVMLLAVSVGVALALLALARH